MPGELDGSRDDRRLGENHVSLSQMTYETIRARIIDGHYEPGARLVTGTLADEFGVSRLPVREALRQLGAQGFVENIPRRGTIVAMPSATDFFETFDVRVALERLCAISAARNRTDKDVEELASLVATAAEVSTGPEGNWKRLSALNWKFHEALAVASGNRHLVSIIREYAERLAWMYSSASRKGGPVCRQQDHRDLLDAVEQGDPDAAADITMRHTEEARRTYVRLFQDVEATRTASSDID